MFPAFTVDFQKVYKSYILFFVASHGLIDTLFCTVASLKVLSIIVLDVETKVLDTETFP